MERLQKVIAQSGVTSRRKAEELIVDGKVFVNGNKVTELGTKVDPQVDKV
ncbi:S4 domain-containing protein, partial [Pseudomonas sp. 2822-17]